MRKREMRELVESLNSKEIQKLLEVLQYEIECRLGVEPESLPCSVDELKRMDCYSELIH